jgi:hypothetical protein
LRLEQTVELFLEGADEGLVAAGATGCRRQPQSLEGGGVEPGAKVLAPVLVNSNERPCAGVSSASSTAALQ